MWEQIRQRDVLLFYPYHSMQPFLDLLRQSAADPAVVSIQMTIYRVAKKSAVIKHLCAAAENGKSVTVLVELRARFDEGNNITWARELEEAGCRVIYGPAGYKCHGKICLITRQEKNGLSYVTQIGTGNYNEKTAALYTDFSLLTADRSIAADGVAFFQNMLIGDLRGSYGKLLVAPVSLKQTLLRLIDGEIARGDRGRIILKTNAVTERELIDKLAEASQAGVRVDLIVRGICCLVPGVPGKTDHITVTSIVGQFLEHSRIYCFGEGTLRQMYLSSADIMTRNQERRVEIACPVESQEARDFLSDYLARLLGDNVKETINLSVMLDREIFYLDKVETFRSVVCNTKVGTRAPAHATSGGKIMLAFHDPAYVDAYCRDLPQMQRLTDHTVFSPDLLREQLAQARINGFAIDDGEIEPGLICVGAPIFGLDQTVVAAVSIAGPTFRMKEELDVMTRAVKATAANISRLMGGRP